MVSTGAIFRAAFTTLLEIAILQLVISLATLAGRPNKQREALDENLSQEQVKLLSFLKSKDTCGTVSRLIQLLSLVSTPRLLTVIKCSVVHKQKARV